ncbi:SH3 domain-containing protein [Brevibacillus fluminis]|uniref:SH3 domain-containing protein n=1 Tax=Brevibacillus fluminis TaxID=511487 RepID=A0A3M8DQV0_9BACL|nr:SH3 domain-containing protein [Brevibacillus fluminis]RNB90452.1 SH3 domain-containing protein [Brevibacillus fluminis]
MSFYQKTTLVRNILLIAFALAFLAVVLKLYASAREVSLIREAEALYKQNKLEQAVERFSSAQTYDAITYGDPEIREALGALDQIHSQLADIDARLSLSHEGKDYKALLETYRSYADLKASFSQKPPAQKAYFQQISTGLSIEKDMQSEFSQYRAQFEAQMANNLKKGSYQDESFIPNLIAMPGDYFEGGKEKELTALFKNYDRKKFRDQKENQSFATVVGNTAKSLRLYQENHFNAPWLVDALEQYGLQTLSKESANIEAFINDAKLYEQIKDVLPNASDVLALIDRKIDGFFTKAEQYVKGNAFDKAIELYQALGAYKSTASYLTQLQDRWLDHDPLQLLQKQYPDKTFSDVVSGKDRFGAQLYAAGVADGNQLYYAAKLTDGDVRFWDAALDDSTRVKKLSLTESIAENNQLVLLVESTSPNRKSTFTGYAVNPSSLKKWFLMEADGLTVQEPGLLVFENPVGEGEGQTEAPYQLHDSSLSYIGKTTDEPSDSGNGESGQGTDGLGGGNGDTGTNGAGESGGSTDNSGNNTIAPADGSKPVDPAATPKQLVIQQITNVHASPDAGSDVIGQVTAGDTLQIEAEKNGWYRIEYNGAAGWIKP